MHFCDYSVELDLLNRDAIILFNWNSFFVLAPFLILLNKQNWTRVKVAKTRLINRLVDTGWYRYLDSQCRDPDHSRYSRR